MGRVLCPLGLDVGGQGSSTLGLAPLTVDACGTQAGAGASGRPSWQRTSKHGTDGWGASRVWLAEASHVRGARAGLCPLRTLVHSGARATPPAWPLMPGEPPPGAQHAVCCCPALPKPLRTATMGAVCERRSAGLAGVGVGGQPAQPQPLPGPGARAESTAMALGVALSSQSRPPVGHNRTTDE